MTPATIRTLLFDDPIPAMLGDAEGWKRRYGRTDACGNATLLYERLVGSREIAAVQVGGQGDIALSGWRDDPALPQMDAIARRRPGLIPVRYRPGKRLTFRLGGHRDLYCKALADERGRAILGDARTLWDATRRGELAFGVARPAAWLPGQKLVAMHAIEAEPVADRIFGEGGVEIAHRMGSANASLATSSLRPAQCYDYSLQIERSRKYARRIAKRAPNATPHLERLLDLLARVKPGPADRPIHGAPHLHQWLVNYDGLHLVDFDRFGFGDPELDVATFVAEMEFEGDPGAAAIAQAYRDGFSSRHPLDPKLYEAYRLHKHLAKALRLISSIRLDAAERCLEVLRNAERQAEALA